MAGKHEREFVVNVHGKLLKGKKGTGFIVYCWQEDTEILSKYF